MLQSFRAGVWLSLFCASWLFSACAPVQPAVRDGAGNLLPLLNDAIRNVSEVARSGVFDDPIDSTPSPDGSVVYFTATSPAGDGVFSVSATGGEPAVLHAGAPFSAVRGIAVSGDGQTLFVADADARRVWVLPTTGGTPESIASTEGIAAIGVEVKPAPAGDGLYVTGEQDGVPGVWRVTPGQAPAALHTGAPLVAPMGVAIASDGALYVVDHDGYAPGRASVFRVANNTVTPIAENFRAGHQAGAALTADDSLLVVSALDIDRDQAQVLLINLSTLEKGVMTKVVSANSGSGGVHRAHNVNRFSWADYRGPGRSGSDQQTGQVYIVDP